MNYDYLGDDSPMNESERHAARFFLMVLLTLSFFGMGEGYVLSHPLSLGASVVVEAMESSAAF